ncbi:MAG TPA: hypothetical protein DCQ73_01140 [Spirochaetaceae bacterium]|nr:hypothetical protein [Spirochaetaceae bacterium]HAX37379.1 hypothetical protein [Spirochaetaceae bacterium]
MADWMKAFLSLSWFRFRRSAMKRASLAAISASNSAFRSGWGNSKTMSRPCPLEPLRVRIFSSSRKSTENWRSR